MFLGDIIGRLHNPSVAAEMLLSLESLALVAHVNQRASVENMTVGEFSAKAIDQFVAQASDEDWLTLTGLMSHSMRPGEVFFKRALTVAIERWSHR